MKKDNHDGLVFLAILFLIFAPVNPSAAILMLCLVGGVLGLIFAMIEAGRKL